MGICHNNYGYRVFLRYYIIISCTPVGTCFNLVGSFGCLCDSDWSGKTCGQNIDACEDDSPCLHGGICADTAQSFTCNCTATGYTGLTCNKNVNECEDNTQDCLNGGTCQDVEGSYICQCSQDFTGRFP